MGIQRSKPVGFAMFLVISLFTLVAEQGMTSYLAYHLYSSGHLAWFALTSGLLIVSSVAVQLTSYQWQARADVGGRARCTTAIAVATHALQCGMGWRYGRMTLSRRIAITRRELWEMFALRMFATLANTLPQLLAQIYLFLQSLGGAVVGVSTSIIGATIAVSLTSACWALATYRKPIDYCCVIGAVPSLGTVTVTLCWRLGELTARLLTLALFATVHGYWLFLVLCLHWGSMLAMCLVDRLVLQSPPATTVTDVAVTSYIYVFCYLTMTSRPSRHARVLYHVTATLEAGTLLLLWLVGDTALTSRHVVVSLLVTGAYTVGAVMAVLYYNCFHQPRPSSPPPGRHSTDTCLHQCINCRLSCCDKHSRKMQRPHVATWVNVLHAQVQYDIASRRAGRTRTYGRREIGGPSPATQWCPTSVERSADRFHEKHVRTRDLMQTGPEFLWDNYDLQLPASNPASLRVKCQPRSPSGGGKNIRRSPGVAVADQGYHSGISTSTKATCVSHTRYPADRAAEYFDDYGDTWGDTCTTASEEYSAYTATSCSAGTFNRERCDQYLSTDSTSVYSVRSGTSFSSVQPDYQLRSQRLKEERRRFKYGLKQHQQRANVANIRHLSYSSDPSAPSEFTSGTEYYTDGL